MGLSSIVRESNKFRLSDFRAKILILFSIYIWIKLIITIEKLTSKNFRISVFKIEPASKLFIKDFWIMGAEIKRRFETRARIKRAK